MLVLLTKVVVGQLLQTMDLGYCINYFWCCTYYSHYVDMVFV